MPWLLWRSFLGARVHTGNVHFLSLDKTGIGQVHRTFIGKTLDFGVFPHPLFFVVVLIAPPRSEPWEGGSHVGGTAGLWPIFSIVVPTC